MTGHAGLTTGTLLGGRVRYMQPADGLRSGIEPVLLAASVPARAGERVLEGGSGAGAGLLCLAGRIADVVGVGIERDPALAALAAANALENGWAGLSFLPTDLLVPDAGPTGFDHAFANPPYHAAGGTPSPDRRREAAVRSGAGGLAAWAMALARRVRPGGTVTLSVPAATLTDALAGLAAAGCGGRIVFPLWPRAGAAAKLVLVRGTIGSRAPDRLASGLVLHEGDSYAEATDAVLRDAAALTMA